MLRWLACLVRSSLALVPFFASVGCGGASEAALTTPTAASFDPGATNASKCGGCHAPHDPGDFERAHIEKMFKVHKAERRAALTEDQWAKMVDYLAKK